MKNINNIFQVINKSDLDNKNVLFLQGPMSFFFKQLSLKLEDKCNCSTSMACFNGGDYIFSRNRLILNKDFNNNLLSIQKYILNNNIHFIFLLGDERKIHSSIIKWIHKHHSYIKIYVFEEGYFRPFYITLEKNGVNNNSDLISKISFDYLNKINLNDLLTKYVPPKPLKNISKKMHFYAIYYYIAKDLGKYFFPKYKHHKKGNTISEAYYGLVSYLRYLIHKVKDKKYISLIKNDIKKQFIFFPLQVHDDFQIKSHSPFDNVEDSIDTFFYLYAKHKSTEYIVIKHHPMNRGKKNYKGIINKLAYLYNIDKNKIIYVFDLDLKMCLENAKKCVTVNSTVGFSALQTQVPLFVLGEANYKYNFLVLNEYDFFNNVFLDNHELYLKYKYLLINKTQLNGSFYINF